jgi:tripartite-type tricarboxylate transporter receptor subunit TctC
VSWVGLLATGGTPKPIIDRLNAAVNEALRDPDTVARLAKQGNEVGGGSADDFKTMIAAEIKNWTEVARKANIAAK